jgi:hypothetical protein
MWLRRLPDRFNSTSTTEQLKPYAKPAKNKIIPAFNIDGVTYYQFEEISNLPILRYFAALRVYEELDMKLTHEMLQIAIDEVLNLINKNKITEAVKILYNIKDRSTMLVEPETLYRLASVVFFTEDEDPNYYDYSIRDKKIKLWREKGLDVFFCKMLMSDLITYTTTSQVDIEDYLKGVNLKTLKDLQYILQRYSERETPTEAMLTIKSQMEILVKSLESKV